MTVSSEGDIWEELEKMETEDIEDLRKEKKSSLNSIDGEKKDLRSERKDQIQIVKSLRSAIGNLKVIDSGRRALLNDFHKIRKGAQEKKEVRDSINSHIPPPSNILEEWLKTTYNKMTTIDNDLTQVPMLNRELDTFSRFFEIQASIIRKRVAEKAHEEYSSSVKEMRIITSKLDENRERSKDEVSKTDGGRLSEGDKISRKEVRKISKRISAIDKRLDELDLERKDAAKILSRVEKYVRISSSRGERVKISDIKGIAARGESLSTTELGALIDSGGLSDLSDQEKEEESVSFPNKPRRKIRKLGVSRGGTRRGTLARRKEE